MEVDVRDTSSGVSFSAHPGHASCPTPAFCSDMLLLSPCSLPLCRAYLPLFSRLDPVPGLPVQNPELSNSPLARFPPSSFPFLSCPGGRWYSGIRTACPPPPLCMVIDPIHCCMLCPADIDPSGASFLVSFVFLLFLLSLLLNLLFVFLALPPILTTHTSTDASWPHLSTLSSCRFRTLVHALHPPLPCAVQNGMHAILHNAARRYRVRKRPSPRSRSMRRHVLVHDTQKNYRSIQAWGCMA